MKCNECQEALSAYYDKMLDKKQTAAVAAHLEECDACKQEYEQLIKILGCLKKQQEEITVPPLLHQKMLDKVAKEAQKGKVKYLWPQRIGGMVAVLLVGIIVIKISPLEMKQMTAADENYTLSASELVDESVAEMTEEVADEVTMQVADGIAEQEEAHTRMMADEENAKLAVASQQEAETDMQETIDGENTAVATKTLQELAESKAMSGTQVWQIESSNIDDLTQYLESYAKNIGSEMEILQEDQIAFVLHGVIDTKAFFEDLQAQSFTKSLIAITEMGENIKIVVKA